MSLPGIATIFVKFLKLLLNLIIIGLYRGGNGGKFLGASYRGWLDDGNIDAEILSSGVIVGYLVFNICLLVTYFTGGKEVKRTPLEIIMNFVGAILWLAMGGVTIQFWMSFNEKHPNERDINQNLVDTGVALGALGIIEGGIYIVDGFLSVVNFQKE